MIRRSDVTVSDTLNTPLAGVYVTVLNSAGVAAALYLADGATPKANPFQSGVGGVFEYYAPEGTYTEEYRLTLSGQPRQVVAVTLGGQVHIPVATRAALAALNTTAYTTAWLSEDYRFGEFKWSSADLSAQVTDDPGQGVYVPPASAPTGASGAWVRQFVQLTPEMFGAVPDAVPGTGAGTPSTTAVNRAITFSTTYGLGLWLGGGYYLIGTATGGVVVQAASRIEGVGPHNCGFVVATGTVGKAFTDAGSASKVGLRGFAIYCRDVEGITYGFDLGNNGTQFGTEGFIEEVWVRGVKEGTAVRINGNASRIRNITAQSALTCFKLSGNANKASKLIAMQAGEGEGGVLSATPANALAFDVRGWMITGYEVEAPGSGSIPVKMYGDSRMIHGTMSLANGRTHPAAFEIDETGFLDWEVQTEFLGTGTLTSGFIKYMPSATFAGGTNRQELSGVSWGKRYRSETDQRFMIRMTNTGGVLQHRIGSHTDSSVAGEYNRKITAASTAFTNTPTGADGSTAFAAGAKISSVTPSVLILDVAAQVAARMVAGAAVKVNTTTASYVVWPQANSRDVNGTTRVRLELQLLNPTTGAAVAWSTALGVDQLIDVQVDAELI